MSADRQIDQTCPHLVTQEALSIAADRVTVRPMRPISNSASVKLLLNNEIDVPSSGAGIPARIFGSRRGPFTFTSGVNNVLQLKVNQGDVQTASLPTSFQMGAVQVANRLNQQLQGVTFSVVNETLRIETQDSGPQSSVFLTAASTVAAVFGFTTNREFRGQQIAPGWTLVSDPSTLSDRPTRLIVFDEPLKSMSDFVEIDYTTVKEECRRCGGSGYENDWRYDANGDLIEIRDEGLLIQELQKDFYTLRGSNPFHPWYGTGIIEAIGKKLSAGGFAQNLVVADIHQAFNRWQDIKRQQEEKLGQLVTDREYPFRLLSVNLEQSTQDQTVIFVSITVQNRSSEPIQLTRGLRIPQSSQLSSSGTIRQSLSSSFTQIG